MRNVLTLLVLLAGSISVMGQSAVVEKRVSLNEVAVALDGSGAPVLEATLKTTSLNGAVDSPVTNTRVVLKNTSSVSYAYVSGLITFYDNAGVRCGEGLFKADVLSANEEFETDTPGIRIRCSPTSWRIVATNLVPRLAPAAATSVAALTRAASLNLVISVDGEEHPIQLDRPMVVTLGSTQRTIVVREAP